VAGPGWKVDVVKTAQLWVQDAGPNAGPEMRELARLVDEARHAGVMTDQRAQRLCQSGLKQVALAMMQYSQDWDEKLPPARSWNEALLPYNLYKPNKVIFCCPLVTQGGFSMNAKLSRAGLHSIIEPSRQVAFYDSSSKAPGFGLGFDASFRHEIDDQKGANYAFADGHVKWYPSSRKQQFNFRP
jgi:prepilin-type processing-associated H-X9-DG protein